MNNSIFGRYEFRGGSSKKFWHIVFDNTTQTCTAYWGRIGNNAQSKTYTRTEAFKKIQEKINKGYIKVKGYEEEVGSTAINYILTDEVA